MGYKQENKMLQTFIKNLRRLLDNRLLRFLYIFLDNKNKSDKYLGQVSRVIKVYNFVSYIIYVPLTFPLIIIQLTWESFFY